MATVLAFRRRTLRQNADSATPPTRPYAGRQSRIRGSGAVPSRRRTLLNDFTAPAAWAGLTTFIWYAVGMLPVQIAVIGQFGLAGIKLDVHHLGDGRRSVGRVVTGVSPAAGDHIQPVGVDLPGYGVGPIRLRRHRRRRLDGGPPPRRSCAPPPLPTSAAVAAGAPRAGPAGRQ